MTVAEVKIPSSSTPPWLFSTPPLLIESIPGPNGEPTNVPPATVTVEPGPEIVMALATPRLWLVCREPPLMTESVPPRTVTPKKPSTVSLPPLIVSPPPKQSHNVRSPPIRPILPPLLAPVRVSVAVALEISSEPSPENEPDKVVLVVGVRVRKAPGEVGPMTTVPPPAGPSVSAPIGTSPRSPTTSVAPALTAKLGRDEEVLLTVLLMVNEAPLVTVKE